MNRRIPVEMRRRRCLPHAVADLAAWFYLIAGIGSATRKAATVDETAHLAAPHYATYFNEVIGSPLRAGGRAELGGHLHSCRADAGAAGREASAGTITGGAMTPAAGKG